MATSPMKTVFQHLRKAVLCREAEGMTDGQLLKHFIEARDERAFAALVLRHGPMVLGVCRRVLGNIHDAGRQIAGGDRIGRVRTQCGLVLTRGRLTIARQLLHEAKCGMQIRICLIPAAALGLLQQLHRPMPGLHIAPFGKLKVGESQFAITRESATHHREVTRMCNALVQR